MTKKKQTRASEYRKYRSAVLDHFWRDKSLREIQHELSHIGMSRGTVDTLIGSESKVLKKQVKQYIKDHVKELGGLETAKRVHKELGLAWKFTKYQIWCTAQIATYDFPEDSPDDKPAKEKSWERLVNYDPLKQPVEPMDPEQLAKELEYVKENMRLAKEDPEAYQEKLRREQEAEGDDWRPLGVWDDDDEDDNSGSWNIHKKPW